MKKYLAVLMMVAAIMVISSVCFASDIVPCVFVNGNMLETGDDFELREGTVYGRAQRLSEIFGYTFSSDVDGFVHSFSDNVRTVTYDSYAGTVNIGDRNSFAYRIFDNAYVPLYSIDEAEKTFIPLRMLCEAFEMPILYNEDKNEIYITKNVYQKGLYNSSGTAIVWQNGEFGLMNTYGTLVANFEYERISNYDNPELFKVMSDRRYGLCDSNGNFVVDIDYTEIDYVSDGEIYLIRNNKKGMCDATGKIIIPVEFEDIVFCGNSIAMVKTGAGWHLYYCSDNTFGDEFYDNVYKLTAGIQTDNALIMGYYVEKKGKWGYIDSFGNKVIDLKYEALDKFDRNGRARMISNGKVGIIDCGGKVIIPPGYDFIHPFGNLNITVAQVGAKYGAIDKNGNAVIPFEYDYIYSFNDAPSTICYKDGKFAVLSTDGALLTGPVYSYAEEFAGTLALVYKNGYGFVDHSGKEVVECIHEEVKRGSALSMFLKLNGRWALFSSGGKISQALSMSRQARFPTVFQRLVCRQATKLFTDM